MFRYFLQLQWSSKEENLPEVTTPQNQKGSFMSPYCAPMFNNQTRNKSNREEALTNFYKPTVTIDTTERLSDTLGLRAIRDVAGGVLVLQKS